MIMQGSETIDKDLIQSLEWSNFDLDFRVSTSPFQDLKNFKKNYNLAKEKDFFLTPQSIQKKDLQSQQQFNPKQSLNNTQKILKDDLFKKPQNCQIGQNIIKNKFNYEKIGINLFEVSQKSEQNIKQQQDKNINNIYTDQDDKRQFKNYNNYKFQNKIKPLNNIVYNQDISNLSRPISTLGGQRKILKFKVNIDEKLPKLKPQKKSEIFFQNLKQNQYKNVKQLKDIKKSLQYNEHTKSNPQFIIQNQLKINNYNQKMVEIDDQFQDLLVQSNIDNSQYDEFGKVVINSKRDITRDNTLATNNFQSNLDQSFLNLFA